MSESIDILQELLPEMKQYLQGETEPSLEGFKSYLAAQALMPEAQIPGPSSALSLMGSYQDDRAMLAFHISRLGKYAKYYVKEALKGSPLVTGDDFGFLASIIEKGEMSKSALISYNVHEVPGGMDVIKRLVQHGLIKERVDPDDRRMKLLSATDEGKQAFFQITQRMQKVSEIVKGDLSPNELSKLNGLLGRLDHFHEIIYKGQKDYDLENILITYMKDAQD